MANTIKINPQVLAHYIEKSNITIAELEAKIQPLHAVLQGDKDLTFTQITDLAKRVRIPMGLLLLKEPIDLIPETANFRTADPHGIGQMSSELRDTILDLESKQEFLREQIEEELAFIGTFTIDTPIKAVLKQARQLLQIDNLAIDGNRSILKNPLNFFRQRISELGVFIFFNGKVGDNTHRLLTTDEFRGLVLSDMKAPIIFINQSDSKNGQLFTLIHEFVHLLLNQNEIFNVIETKDYAFSPLEAYVNQITANLLVPSNELMATQTLDLEILSDRFPASKFTIVRRLLDNQLITKVMYDMQVELLNTEFAHYSSQKLPGGGNYRNNLKFRIDATFVNYVKNAVNSNTLTPTDAMNIIGVGYKGYQTLQGDYFVVTLN